MLALGASDCEALRVGWLAQPANTVSSLAYVVAAAAVLWRGGPRVPAVALGIVGLGSVLYHGPMSPGAETVHDGSILAMLAVGAVTWKRGALPRPPVAALAALGAGVAVNLLTRTGAPLCRPDSLVQGHAAWHVLTAAAAAAWLGRRVAPPRPSTATATGPVPATERRRRAAPATSDPAGRPAPP